ncbi:MAG: homeobox domain-containing protein [Terriglobus roseus]|nr:homeobox domain-containing protein [Terriglobus roseus]
MEKTHAQIKSQQPQTESPVERPGYTPTHQTPTLPLHPGRGSYFPPTLRSEQLSPSQPTSPAQVAGMQHHSPTQPLYARPTTAYHGHAPAAHPSQVLPGVPPSPHDAPSSSGVGTRKRRGNLPRDAVRLFKKWVEDNKKHPYPNEAQKQEFERVTGLSMQQINNWFINARRRNLTPKEREDMKREKERQSQSGSPASSRPDDGQDLPDADDFSLAGPSGQGDRSGDQSMGGS